MIYRQTYFKIEHSWWKWWIIYPEMKPNSFHFTVTSLLAENKYCFLACSPFGVLVPSHYRARGAAKNDGFYLQWLLKGLLRKLEKPPLNVRQRSFHQTFIVKKISFFSPTLPSNKLWNIPSIHSFHFSSLKTTKHMLPVLFCKDKLLAKVFLVHFIQWFLANVANCKTTLKHWAFKPSCL